MIGSRENLRSLREVDFIPPSEGVKGGSSESVPKDIDNLNKEKKLHYFEKDNFKKLIKEHLAKFGLSYEKRLLGFENAIRYKILEKLLKINCLTLEDGKFRIDRDRTKSFLLGKSENMSFVSLHGVDVHLSRELLIKVLDGIKVYDGEMQREILRLPLSKEKFLYPAENVKGKEPIFKLTDFYSPSNVFSDSIIKLRSGERISLGELFCRAKLIENGLYYDKTLDLQENRRILKLYEVFIENKILFKKGNNTIVDTEAYFRNEIFLKEIKIGATRGSNESRLTAIDAMELFKKLRGFTAEQVQSEAYKNHEIGPQAFIELPINLRDLVTKEAWSSRADKAIFKPWDMRKSQGVWTKKFTLQDADVNVAELGVAYELLHTLNAERNPTTGLLEIIDPETGKRLRFSTGAVDRLVNFNPSSVSASGKRLTFKNNGLQFAQEFLPNLLRVGFLKTEDFRLNSIQETAEQIGQSKRFIGKNYYIRQANKQHDSIGYYIGKEKYVGTQEKIDPERDYIQEIDVDTIGIFRLVKGNQQGFGEETEDRQELLYTFQQLPQSEIAAIKEMKREEFAAKGRELTLNQLTANTIVGSDVTKHLLQPYSVVSFFPQRADEAEKDYKDRLSYLKDAGKVLQDFHTFCSDTGIPVSAFEWSQKVILANALKSGVSYERIKNYTRTFDVDGVKMLLASEYDVKLVLKVLDIAEKHPEYVKELAPRFAKIIEHATNITKHIPDNLLANATSMEVSKRLPFELREALVRRAKDLIQYPEKLQYYHLNENAGIEASKGLERFLDIIRSLVEGNKNYKFVPVANRGGSVIFTVRDTQNSYEYTLKTFVRSQADLQGQARVNFELHFDTKNPDIELQEAFQQSIYYKNADKIKNPSVLRIGFDLEDATEQPTLSLDLGRNAYEDEKMSRTGDILARVLSVADREGAHTQDSFSDIFAPHFKIIAESFVQFLQIKDRNFRQESLDSRVDQK